jgi:myosin regulatory light chain 12
MSMGQTQLNCKASILSSLGRGLPTGIKKSGHGQREPSGAAYTMFTTEQVKQFKEAFNMIDQDGDGRVTEDDLRVMLSNLGTYTLSSNLALFD